MNVDARVSAAYDDAARCAQLQATLEAAGWTVRRRVLASVMAIELERDSGIPGLVESITFPHHTMLEALIDAVSWALNEEVSG